MTEQAIFDILIQDGNYIIYFCNEHRSTSITKKNRIFDAGKNLKGIHICDDGEDLTIRIDQITSAEVA
jgi:hypothetical protein